MIRIVRVGEETIFPSATLSRNNLFVQKEFADSRQSIFLSTAETTEFAITFMCHLSGCFGTDLGLRAQLASCT